MQINVECLKKLQIKLSDKMLEFLIALTEKKIKNFCDIDEIPEELKETQIQMCMDLYELRYKEKQNISDTESESSNTQEIKSIKRGDTQIDFNSIRENELNEKQVLTELINSDSFLFNYENELYDFRKFRW